MYKQFMYKLSVKRAHYVLLLVLIRVQLCDLVSCKFCPLCSSLDVESVLPPVVELIR